MLIRPYREADRATLHRLTVEAFAGVSIEENIERQVGAIAGHDWRWRKARHIDRDIEAPGSAIWVAEDENGAVVGYVTTRLDVAAGVGLVPNLAVCAGLRGQGIGRQLLECALQRFREAGLEVARIETLEQNPIGRHLYPSCGFVEVARQVHFAMRL